MVRSIMSEDGQEKIQLRLDLGLLQMEVDGRPDGQLIHGQTSWLEFYTNQQQTHATAHPEGPPFSLDSKACQVLLREGVQYYHRYLSFWHLRRFELCARDTKRNLQLFAFVREFAETEQDKLQFDQWRPYVIMMHTRAVAMPLVEMQLIDAALPAIDAGITGIEEFLREYDQESRLDSVRELLFLKRWREELVGLQEPSPDKDFSESFSVEVEDDPLSHLNAALHAAIEEEQYEEAARLRDEIQRLKGLSSDPPEAS